MMSSTLSSGGCRVCGVTENLKQCSKCRQISYCGKEHQIQDWTEHKKTCTSLVNICKTVEQLTLHNSQEVSNSGAQTDKKNPATQWAAKNSVKLEPFSQEEVTAKDEKVAANIWKQLQDVGITIINNFLLPEHAEKIYQSVKELYEADSFIDGEVLKQGSNVGPERVRSDRITWVDENYSQCMAVRHLCKKLDRVVKLCIAHSPHEIEARTKPMIACYPGNGTHYKRHVDNPAGDGRILTCLYYLNKDWNYKVDGGLLCLYPVHLKKKVSCEPVFNRLCVFFSDSRIPHEVLHSHKPRFAITCWYFDKEERDKALENWARRSKPS